MHNNTQQEQTERVALSQLGDNWNTMLLAMFLGILQGLTVRTIIKQFQNALTERSAFFKGLWSWLVMLQIALVEITIIL